MSRLTLIDVKGSDGARFLIWDLNFAELVLVAQDVLLQRHEKALCMLGSIRAKSRMKSELEWVIMAKLAYSP